MPKNFNLSQQMCAVTFEYRKDQIVQQIRNQ